jgi:D-3-phosphoglycerate dehydrogenase
MAGRPTLLMTMTTTQSDTRRLAILDDYQRVALTMADWSAVEAQCSITVFDRPFQSLDETAAALAGFEIVCLMRERTRFPRALIERLPSLKLIVFTGSILRSLDVDAARDRGITVCHTRGGQTEYPTAELTWALLLAAARHLTCEDRAMKSGGWQTTMGVTLKGRTLGVLGLGRIGSRVVSFGRAFGMSVIAWSANLTDQRATDAGAQLVSKEDLFRLSDVVSIHVVSGERTRGLVGRQELALMKREAILVNTARGPIVDEAALIEALQQKRIRAGLDVFDEEPLPRDHVLRTFDNVVLTPHLGYVSLEVYRVYFADVVEAVLAYLAGTPVRAVSS